MKRTKDQSQQSITAFFNKKKTESDNAEVSMPSTSTDTEIVSVPSESETPSTSSGTIPTHEKKSLCVPPACKPDAPLDISTSEQENPVQPNLKAFPVTSKRKFNIGYYKKFEWVEYSESQDSVYCFACRHFSGNAVRKGEILGKRTFIDMGFRKWKDCYELLGKHEQSERHVSSMTGWLNFKTIESKKDSSVVDKLCTNRIEEVKKNREHVKCLLRVTSLLGRQALPFRGHDESETSLSKGNFIETLEMLTETSEILQKKMQSRYGHYTSPEYQNDLIQVFGDKIVQNISAQIQKAKYYSILVDETKDLSRKEQLSLIIRYFDGEVIQERCCGTYHMQKLDAESLANFILRKIEELGLKLSDCIAQCYDGASVMSGWASGVQARISEKIPHAIYIHCYAHRLNLVLINCINNLDDFKDFFSTVQTLYNFISNSNTRHELFVKSQKELGLEVLELERTVTTRWFYWYRSIRKIHKRYEAILAVLNSLSEFNNESSVEASGLKSKMESWKFVLCLFLSEKLFLHTNCLSEQLQEEGMSIIRAVDLISVTREGLDKMRRDSAYDEIYEEAGKFANELSIYVPEENEGRHMGLARSKRVQRISDRLKDYLSNSTLGKRPDHLATAHTSNVNVKQSLKTQLYFPVIDRCIAEYDRRFSKNINLFESLSSFDVQSQHFLGEEKLTMFSKHYSVHIDSDRLVSQAHCAREFLDKKKPDDLFNAYKILNTLPTAFSELQSVLQIVLTIPVSTASNERFFSVLKRVKSYLRTTIGDNRLCSLMLMATEKSMVKSLDLEELVDDFAHLKHRRYPLL